MRGVLLMLVLVLVLVLGACASQRPDAHLIEDVRSGQFGYARSYLRHSPSRGAFTDLAHLALVNLADGMGEESERVFNDLYDLLRLRGVNAGSRLAAVVLHEGVKVYRGEPFEQAMLYAAIAIQKAVMGDFDNTRAAAIGALELLDEFDDLRYARPADAAGGGHPYAVQDTGFALGYMLAGLGALGMGREEEARDYFLRGAELREGLGEVGRVLLEGGADGLLIIDYGLGPRKVAAGRSGEVEAFVARTPSDARRVRVGSDFWAAAEDVNELAALYAWDDLRGVRGAKAAIGDVLVTGGAVVTATGDNDTETLIGLGLIGLGLLSRASAAADTRQIEILPQRVYLVPIRLADLRGPLTIEVEGDPGSRLVLPMVRSRREGEHLRVMYVRLLSGAGAPEWATSGQIRYVGDASEPALPDLPYILGGRDVRTPTARVMRDYHAAGLDSTLTSNDMRELYRSEGIRIGVDGTGGNFGRHVLEGGNWLFTPAVESTGFVRLFAGAHPPHEPRSKAVRDLIRTLRERIDTHEGGGS